jgi:hypothetical protein
MELITIFQISFGVSVFGFLFIFFRNLPLIPEYKVKYVPKEKRISFKFKRGVSEGKVKTAHRSHKIQERIGHRLRIWLLKLDNVLSSRLQKIKERRSHLENVYFADVEEEKEKKKKRKDIEDKEVKKRGE